MYAARAAVIHDGMGQASVFAFSKKVVYGKKQQRTNGQRRHPWPNAGQYTGGVSHDQHYGGKSKNQRAALAAVLGNAGLQRALVGSIDFGVGKREARGLLGAVMPMKPGTVADKGLFFGGLC